MAKNGLINRGRALDLTEKLATAVVSEIFKPALSTLLELTTFYRKGSLPWKNCLSFYITNGPKNAKNIPISTTIGKF